MSELGWVRLSEGALEHLLDHLVETRHSGFGVIEYRDIASVASALWEIKEHNLNLMVTPWHDDEEPTETFEIHDKTTGRVIADMEAWLAQKSEGLKAEVEALSTGQGAVAPEEEESEGRSQEALSRKSARRRQEAEEAGFTLEHFESMLGEHGLDAMAAYLGQSKMTAGNVAAMSRRQGYPIPSAVRWLKHLADSDTAEAAEPDGGSPEAEVQVQPKAVGPTQVISFGRAKELCRTGKGTSAIEQRFISAFQDSGLDAGTFIATLQELHGMAVVP